MEAQGNHPGRPTSCLSALSSYTSLCIGCFPFSRTLVSTSRTLWALPAIGQPDQTGIGVTSYALRACAV